MKNILLFFLCFQVMNGVFGDSVSVKEGDCLSLHTGLAEIEKEDVIQWRFETIVIAQIIRTINSISIKEDVLNGKFKDRLKLDNQTGDLTIKNIRSEHSGNYDVNNFNTLNKSFNVTAVVEEKQSLIVMEGDSVNLQPDVPEILKYDVIQWRFGQPVVAKIDRVNRSVSTPDVRFRYRLEANYLTGSLKISNIATNCSGLYEVDIRSSNKHTIHKSFYVTVTGEKKTESVLAGKSVTLKTNSTKILKDELIVWMFGGTVIAELSKVDQRFFLRDDDEAFNGRLKLDNQTAALTITKTSTTDSGLYQLMISSTGYTVHERFVVSVTNSVLASCAPPGWSSRTVTWIVFGLLLLPAVVVIGLVKYYRNKIADLKKSCNKDDQLVTNTENNL